MGKVLRTVYVDEDVWKEAQKLNMNISKGFRIYLKYLIYGEKKPLKMTPELLWEIDYFIYNIDGKDPSVFLVPRCDGLRRIKGISIGVNQLRELYNKRLEQLKKHDINIEDLDKKKLGGELLEWES